ncbi:pyrroline-5-carboxylate reductase [Devosia sp. YR412]|uniref:NAD(P)-binding domain-containing protein n=1 Tax=Devosia sp. YR412 TaxID=1881030 RepID=UPI0008CE7AE2|nr:NAD(P)-binding domain-containing protein [Devosia sp. YR412]SEQ56733.1 pyrroline-5-carboxylate reductase [Devosia sp. YR412]
MTTGFIGTGTITAAIIRGLAAAGWTDPIVVSPRNAELSAALAAEHGFVEVARDNQEVVDRSTLVFIAVRPQVFDEAMAPLSFGNAAAVASLVPTISLDRLREVTGPGPALSRAVPLPFVEQLTGPTPIYPPGAACVPLFEKLGRAIVVEQEAQMDVLLAASGTMGSFFLLQAAIVDWMAAQGLDPTLARLYAGELVSGLALSAQIRPNQSFETLMDEFSTRGGLNEQLRKSLEQAGLRQHVGEGLTALLHRVQQG